MSGRIAPKPPGLVLRNAYDFIQAPLDYLLAARQWGDVVRLPLPVRPIYLVQHPDLIEEVLVQKHKDFQKDRFTRDLSDALGQGLLTSEGRLWRRQRKLMQPAFHHRRIIGYAASMTARAAAMLDGWPEQGERDVHQDMMRLTSEIVAETLFGASLGDEAAVVSSAIELVMQRYLGVGGSGIPLPAILPTAQNRAFRRAMADVDRIVYRFIRERRQSDEERSDLLSLLLSTRDEEGGRMHDRQLRDEAVTLFVAGHETTALALSYALHLLARNPAEQQRLADELGALGDARPGFADLRQLPFTLAVIKESMRLYPPAWAIGREAMRDTIIGGWRIPKGAQLSLSQWAVHRDGRFFDEPERFVPARWLDDLESRLPRFAYFPFGGGPRVCIGNSFALTEAQLVLASLVQRYRFEPTSGTEPELVASVTLRPKHGIRLRVQRRSGAQQRPAGQ